MDYLDIWFNLRDTGKDLEFCENLNSYLGHLKSEGLIADFHLSRRKFGFGPSELGEFNIRIDVVDLAQLDKAFSLVATRAGKIEDLHRPVFSMAKDLKSALYRDFPDPVRK
jgi:hypothetical protein